MSIAVNGDVIVSAVCARPCLDSLFRWEENVFLVVASRNVFFNEAVNALEVHALDTRGHTFDTNRRWKETVATSEFGVFFFLFVAAACACPRGDILGSNDLVARHVKFCES